MTANVHFRMFSSLFVCFPWPKILRFIYCSDTKTVYFDLFLHLTLKFLKDLVTNNKEDF